MATSNFQETVLVETAFLFQPLQELNRPDDVIAFLDELGYAVPPSDVNNSLKLTINKFPDLVAGVQQLVHAPEPDKLKKIATLLPILAEVFTQVQGLSNALRSGFVSSSQFFTQAPVDQLPKRAIDYLIFTYLFRRQPRLFGTLFLTGILDEETLANNPFQRNGTVKTIQWERISGYLTHPVDVIDQLYQWNSNYDADKFLQRFQLFLQAMAMPGGLYRQSDSVKQALGNATPNLNELRIPLVTAGWAPDAFSQLGLNLSPAEQIDAQQKKGLALIPYVSGAALTEAELSEEWKLTIQSSLALDAGAGVILRPPLKVETFQNLFSNPSAAGTFELFLTALQIPDETGVIEEMYVFGNSQNTRLTLNKISGTAYVKTSPQSQDAGIEAEIEEVKLVILPGDEADAFMSLILPADGIQASFGFGLGLSLLNGFYFKGAGQIELLIPVHIQLGPVSIQHILIALALESSEIPVETSATIGGELGPLQVVAERIGIVTTLTFPPDGDGNVGPVHAAMAFKPPAGVGVSLEASFIQGGGYLYLDPQKGEYAGALELSIENFLTLTAIGLVTTKDAAGNPAFSMLIIITAEFMPPLQLSYGFTLNGVGGLLGLDRMVLLDPLREGVSTGAVDGIMFPEEVVANAPRIINDLRTIFPPLEGSFLIGPMAKIGWGTPSLITLSLGVIVQLPDPKIAILGILKMALPTEELDILKIQVNFLGTIDLNEQLITFDASLFDSHLLQILTLTGDMVVRLKWGDQPDFILSAGGFHPDYSPSMAVPNLERIGIKILDLENAYIRVESYFALTSNTVQLGARADCYFGFDGFNVSGDLGFDALLQISPFTFTASASGGFSLDTWLGDASVRITATLKGPAPWYVKAIGHTKVFGLEWEVPFEKTWGQTENDQLPEIAIRQPFLDALSKDECWHSELPEGKAELVALTNPVSKEANPPIRIHPFSFLVISQKFAPLDVELDHLGNKQISDYHLLSIQNITLGVDTATKEIIRDVFASAQYKEVSDADKLSMPSFEEFNSGAKAYYLSNGVTFKHGNAVRREHSYEQIIIDQETRKPNLPRFDTTLVFSDLLKHSAIKQSTLSNSYYQDLGKTLPVTQKTKPLKSYTIVDVDRNQPIDAHLQFANKTLAADALQKLVQGNPALAGQLTVISPL
jgi:hypothetical protein